VLKAYTGLSIPEVTHLAAEGKKVGLRVVVDQGSHNGSTDLMNAGIAAFAHLPRFNLTENAVELAKTKQISFISTLAVYEFLAGRRLRHLDFLNRALIADTAPPWFLEELRAFSSRPETKEVEARRAGALQRLQVAQANALRLWNAGVLLTAGTDANYPGDFQGEGIHHELELLVEAGFTPIEAIVSATRNAAQFMNASADWGTLEPGKLANVLMVDGQPDRNIQDTQNVAMVIKEGVILDRQQLKFNAASDPGFRTSSSVSGVP
jgi:imidazolonepropionase-like amidohydrolase